MHRSASFDSQVLKVAPEREIMAAANAILLALPQISGPTWRDRKKENKNGRKSISAPFAGDSPPLEHQPTAAPLCVKNTNRELLNTSDIAG